MKKLKASQLAKAFSELTKIAKTKGRKRNVLLSQKNDRFLDVVCHCVGNALTNIPLSHFTKDQQKKLRLQKENLRFLRDYINCSHSKRKKLAKQRGKIVQQTGGSLALLLSVVLPLVANALLNKFLPAKK